MKSQNIPKSITIECARWSRDKVQFIARKYYSTRSTLPLQIHLKPDEFATKIIKHQHIKHYRINYAPRDGKEKDNIKHIFSTNIYPFHCLSYTGTYDIRFDRSGYAMVNIIALDHKDRIIEESEQKKLYVNVNSVNRWRNSFDSEAIMKYWKNSIVPKHWEDNKVNVNEWVAALTENEIVTDIDDCKRIFYYILFKAGSDSEEMECGHFEKFVAVQDFDEYNCGFDRCIRAFRKAIPDMIV